MLACLFILSLLLAAGEPPIGGTAGKLSIPPPGTDLASGSRVFDVQLTPKGRYWVGSAVPIGNELSTSNGRELMFVRDVRGHGARLLGHVGFYSTWEQDKPGREWSARYVKASGQLGFEVDLSPYLQRQTLLDASFAGDKLLLGLWDDTVDPNVDGCNEWGQCRFWGIFELEVFTIAAGGEPPLTTLTRESPRPIALPQGLAMWFKYTKSWPAEGGGARPIPQLELGGHSLHSGKTDSMSLRLVQELKNPETIRAEVNSLLGMPLIVFRDGGAEVGRAWFGLADNGNPRLEAAPGNECVRVLAALERLVLVRTPKQTPDQMEVRTLLKELRGGHEVEWNKVESQCGSLATSLESSRELSTPGLKALIERLQ